jgi:hypothetical protein
VGRSVSPNVPLGWRTLLEEKEENLHQLSVSDADALVHSKGWDTTMIKRTMPCGHKVVVESVNDALLKIEVTIDERGENLGITTYTDPLGVKAGAKIYIYKSSLLVLREILDELDPQPWPYRFLNSIRKRWYS